MKAFVGVAAVAAASATEVTCTGSGDPSGAGVCYQGKAGVGPLLETVKVDLKTFASEAGTMALTGTGITAFTCGDHSFTKSGQDIKAELSDCLPSGITLDSVKYCSDDDSVSVTVKDATVPIPISAKLTKVACASEMWKDFKNTFGKFYNGDEDARFEIFKTNLDIIDDVNSKNLSYTLGVNQFADLTADEFASQYTGFKKPTNVWGDLPYLGRDVYSGKALADSLDWTTKGAVTPVKNQGQCGSCWAFSTTGALEGAYEIASGKLVSLSEQQFVDCDKVDAGCNGGLMDNGFKFAEKNAICTEASYKYKAKKGTCKSSSCTVGLAKGSVTGYKDVSTDSEQALMEALNKNPVSIAIEADKSAFQLYKSGVLSKTCGTSLDHGVLAVGYGTVDGQDYWKVKNSWGTTWGDAGYVKLLRGKGGKGECGILSGPPSYPVVSGDTQVVV